MHDCLLPQILNTKILKPCFRRSRRAAGDREPRRKVEHSPVRYKAAPKPNACINWIQSTRLEHNPSTNKKKTKRIVNSPTFPSISRRFYDAKVVMKLAEQCDGHMF